MSRATAVSTWPPFAALEVVQSTAYGAVVSSAPRFAPSSRNCTPDTPESSCASAVTVTVPLTFAPFAGAVTRTVGGAEPQAVVATWTVATPERLPARSTASTPSVEVAPQASPDTVPEVLVVVLTSNPLRYNP